MFNKFIPKVKKYRNDIKLSFNDGCKYGYNVSSEKRKYKSRYKTHSEKYCFELGYRAGVIDFSTDKALDNVSSKVDRFKSRYRKKYY